MSHRDIILEQFWNQRYLPLAQRHWGSRWLSDTQYVTVDATSYEYSYCAI